MPLLYGSIVDSTVEVDVKVVVVMSDSAPTVTVTVLEDVTVTTSAPQVSDVAAAASEAEACKNCPPLLTGKGFTRIVEYTTGAVPVPVGPTAVLFPNPYRPVVPDGFLCPPVPVE